MKKLILALFVLHAFCATAWAMELKWDRYYVYCTASGRPEVGNGNQVCIITFRRDYLIRFNEMEESPLEICESVDMMRILEHGEKVRMVPTDARTWSVDTPEDLARVTRLMEGDALMREYAK